MLGALATAVEIHYVRPEIAKANTRLKAAETVNVPQVRNGHVIPRATRKRIRDLTPSQVAAMRPRNPYAAVATPNYHGTVGSGVEQRRRANRRTLFSNVNKREAQRARMDVKRLPNGATAVRFRSRRFEPFHRDDHTVPLAPGTPEDRHALSLLQSGRQTAGLNIRSIPRMGGWA